MKTKQQLSRAISAAVFAAALLLGSSSVFAQVKIGSNPTTINAANNLEVEASTAGNKVSVDKTTGKVTIADGSQGAGKILTSDANGVATWQTLMEQKVPTTVFIGNSTTTTTLTADINGSVPSRYPLTPVAGYTGYDASQRAYIIPVNGYYRVEWGGRLVGLTSTMTDIVMLLQGDLGISESSSVATGSSVAKTLIQTQYYTAGTPVYGFLWYSASGSAAVMRSYLNVTYISAN